MKIFEIFKMEEIEPLENKPIYRSNEMHFIRNNTTLIKNSLNLIKQQWIIIAILVINIIMLWVMK